MGILDRFKKKEPLPDVGSLPSLPPALPEAPTLEKTTMENVKAKIDLVATQLDSLRTQYETLNERIKNIEKVVTEIRSFCR